MSVVDIEQRTEEWFQARCGSLGASSLHEAIAKTKSGWSASRHNLMARLIVERLTNESQETYQNAAMIHGIETEPQARDAYRFFTDNHVEEIGFVRHPSIDGTHSSPDGLVNDDGVLEIKAPNSSTHINTLLGANIEGKYIIQCQWHMACTGRQWCDWVSFDNRLPGDLQFYCERIERDDRQISELEAQVQEFLKELESKLEQLESLRG